MPCHATINWLPRIPKYPHGFALSFSPEELNKPITVPQAALSATVALLSVNVIVRPSE
jgi:hypothetical protein